MRAGYRDRISVLVLFEPDLGRISTERGVTSTASNVLGMSTRPPTLYPGVDTIRQIQQIMLLAAILPPDGRLADLIRRALDVPEGPLVDRMEPLEDLHPHAVKAWFERNWPADRVSEPEKELIDWQGNSDNMCTAMEELQQAEYRTGVRFTGRLAADPLEIPSKELT
jgi:hypothetical protein